MRTILHRFYDLYSGGGEVTILNMVTALHDHKHILAFNRARESWLTDALQKRENVELIKTNAKQLPTLIERKKPDTVLLHWYPPMSVEDIEPLSSSVLERTVLYNQWFRPIPYLSTLRRVVFVTPWLEQKFGGDYPSHQRSVVINPVRDVFFDVRARSGGPPSVGRHARPVGIKVSSDFFHLYEGIDIPDLQVRILGYPQEILDARLSARGRLKKNYWLVPFNSMKVPEFLSWLDVYVYRTNPSFTEACGISVGEAMAAGIPPIVDNRGGLTSLVSHGETGFLCKELTDYQRAAEDLLNDPTKRREMGEAARTWARENLSTSVFREKLLDALA